MTVVAFKPKEKPQSAIWECKCGCQGFWLYADGGIQCHECEEFHDSMTGYWKILAEAGPA